CTFILFISNSYTSKIYTLSLHDALPILSLFYTISIFYHIIPIMNTHSFKYKNRKQINSDLLSILITYFLHAISLLLLLLYRRIDHMIYIHNEVLLVPHNLSIQLALEYVIFYEYDVDF